jgi:FAD/FMN-containing dehydrogenase
MVLPGKQKVLTNWSKSAASECTVYPVGDLAEIRAVLAAARGAQLTIVPHGAGHSYTDAALNTRGLVLDVTPMRRILAWDPVQGILRAEPGVTLRQAVQATWKDGWWPYVSPSTDAVTLGGCVAMNVNGRNAWKAGPFGAHVLSMDVMLPSGDVCTLTPERDPQLFTAFVGSLGLLGIVTAITLQMQPAASGAVAVRRRPAANLAELLALFAEEEPASTYLEAWLDGFAAGDQLGRGRLTSAAFVPPGDGGLQSDPGQSWLDRVPAPLARFTAGLARPLLQPAVRAANSAIYQRAQSQDGSATSQRPLYPYTYWPSAAFAGYPAMFPQGVETFQAFVPRQHAETVFTQVLRWSQSQGCLPLWCVVKLHRPDPFLLSYQLDGFSLELNYQRTRQNAATLKRVIERMIAMVIEAGGRFYFAKDHFLTGAQFRQSLGDPAVDAFLELKARYDPGGLLQSDLYRRVFQSA